MVHSRGTIMIADDDDDLRELVSGLFERLGFEAQCFQNGEDIVQALGEHESIKAFVIDLLLPFVDGFDLISSIRQHPNTALAPIIILSDLTSEEDIVQAFRYRVNDVVSKPFQPLELKARVLRWIDHEPLPALEEKL